MSSSLSMRSAVAAGVFAKPAARDVKARAGLKVYARMTKDRVKLNNKDSKWRSDINIYPEWGEFPTSERTSPLTSLTYDEYKNNISAEIIHGRFAMLGVTGAWAQENLVGTPWFMAGEECTFDKCTISYLNNSFSPSYEGALLGIIFLEIVLMGGAEGFRTGLLENPFDDVVAGSVFPGGRFDPLNFSEGKDANFFGEDLDTLKIKELKHCRLAMLAWLGILAQSVSTNPGGAGPDAVGPVANWSAHVADVVHCNVVDRSGCVF